MESEPLTLPAPDQGGRLEIFARYLVGDMLQLLEHLAGHGKDKTRQAMGLLVQAEMLLRRLIYLIALRIELPVPAIMAPPPRPGRPASSGPARGPATPRFRLIEPLPGPAAKTADPRPLLAPEECPRITRMDADARPHFAEPPAPRPVRPRAGLEALYLRRTQALADALTDLDGEARRLARWMARQKASGAGRLSPVARLPLPPRTFPTGQTGHTESPGPDPAYPVLTEIYHLAEDVLGPDTG